MNRKYRNLKSVMDMPKHTLDEKMAFNEAVFKHAWTNIYFDLLNDKYVLKKVYFDYGLVKNERFCNIVTAIFSQPYKELPYYRGDDGRYVDNFPPIRFTLTREQANLIEELDKVTQQYLSIYKPLKASDCLLELKPEEKSAMLADIKFAYNIAINKRINKLEKLFDVDLFGCNDDLTDKYDF